MKSILRRMLTDWLGRRRDNFMWRLNNGPLDLSGEKSLVLLGLDGKLGDAILQSSVIKALRVIHPDCRIKIITTANLSDYWRECDGVSEVHTISPRSESLLRRLRELRQLARSHGFSETDVVVSFDPIPMIDYFAFIRWCRPRAAIGLSAMSYAIFPISICDPIFEFPRKHVSERYIRALSALGIAMDIDQLSSIVPRNVPAPSPLETCEANGGRGRFFINGYGASPTRTFDTQQLAYIARYYLAISEWTTIIINVNHAQRSSSEIQALCQAHLNRVTLLPTNTTIVDLFNFIAQSALVLTPDTGIAHIAAATKTSVIVVYDDVDFNPICWRPLGKRVSSLIPRTPRSIAEFSQIELMEAVKQCIAAESP